MVSTVATREGVGHRLDPSGNEADRNIVERSEQDQPTVVRDDRPERRLEGLAERLFQQMERSASSPTRSSRYAR